jgi:hypothetical protein
VWYWAYPRDGEVWAQRKYDCLSPITSLQRAPEPDEEITTQVPTLSYKIRRRRSVQNKTYLSITETDRQSWSGSKNTYSRSIGPSGLVAVLSRWDSCVRADGKSKPRVEPFRYHTVTFGIVNTSRMSQLLILKTIGKSRNATDSSPSPV